ncbi:unnamed protein product [Penicillium nalgiovense]|nr:unnamed protein product [Penicillium nalgiovense]
MPHPNPAGLTSSLQTLDKSCTSNYIPTDPYLAPLLLFKPLKSRRRFNMLIKVRTLTGKEIELDIEPDYKVSRIKERVEEKEGIPPVQQRLIFGGKQM